MIIVQQYSDPVLYFEIELDFIYEEWRTHRTIQFIIFDYYINCLIVVRLNNKLCNKVRLLSMEDSSAFTYTTDKSPSSLLCNLIFSHFGLFLIVSLYACLGKSIIRSSTTTGTGKTSQCSDKVLLAPIKTLQSILLCA